MWQSDNESRTFSLYVTPGLASPFFTQLYSLPYLQSFTVTWLSFTLLLLLMLSSVDIYRNSVVTKVNLFFFTLHFVQTYF